MADERQGNTYFCGIILLTTLVTFSMADCSRFTQPSDAEVVLKAIKNTVISRAGPYR